MTRWGVCFADGMTSYLYQHKIRIFDYPRFAEPFRNRLRENAARMAADQHTWNFDLEEAV